MMPYGAESFGRYPIRDVAIRLRHSTPLRELSTLSKVAVLGRDDGSYGDRSYHRVSVSIERADLGLLWSGSMRSQEVNESLTLEAPMPAAPLDSIIRTEELHKRPSRPPDHLRENSALEALVGALADSPGTILQTLADKVLEVLAADSAGLSLLTKDGQRFYWAAIAGAWRPHLGGGTPRDFGPCGDVLDRNVPMLFTHWEQRYPYLGGATPLAEEGLLVPFFVAGKSVGTIWAIAHRIHRKFDAEDLRLLESMGRFASAAYYTVQSVDELKSEVAARERAETELRKIADGLAVLTASIAHEVNQPLAAIVTNGESALRWLTQDEPDIGKVRTLANRVVADARRASDIIERVRGMARRRSPKYEPLSIEDLIGESLSLLRNELQLNEIDLSFNSSENLAQIIGDRIQLQQVILNLIINAAQAMSKLTPADRRIHVAVTISSPETVCCIIEDSGPGFDAEHLSRLFDSFFTTKDTGMGMGLAICRSIVEAHGGRIRADNNSSLGGARFLLDLPSSDHLREAQFSPG
jgi:signal transduction histidine kinase